MRLRRHNKVYVIIFYITLMRLSNA